MTKRIPTPSCPGCTDPGAAFASHDHGHCAADVLARAEALAADQGARLTPVRRRVLEILLEEHRRWAPMRCLQRLAAEGFGNQPPVAYRALDFLVEQGFAHRIRRLNAFTACMHPGEAHAPGLPDLPGLRCRGRGPRRAGARRAGGSGGRGHGLCGRAHEYRGAGPVPGLPGGSAHDA